MSNFKAQMPIQFQMFKFRCQNKSNSKFKLQNVVLYIEYFKY
jgi:hypothetical protein